MIAREERSIHRFTADEWERLYLEAALTEFSEVAAALAARERYTGSS